ncbi:odorant receptor 67c-like [Zerene cesonia]|uniref:odorant receptor 67c-like n=1 Tax=Zerene cesonia TaxID=33412 RepID=UPI0018E54C3D|nr:odorant receptor 67c-like [Zerene cesonia]
MRRHFLSFLLAFIVCFNIFGADTTFHAFCLYLRMHFEILCYRFEGVVTPCARETKSCIRSLVQRHQQLIQLVNEIEQLYSKSTLFNIVVSSVLICLSVFNVTFINDFGAVFSFISFLVMSLYQIFMSCYFGDMIVTSSLQVREALYKCKWYDAEPQIKRTIHIIMLRSQKPCSVTAAKFATLNISAFTTILSRSWSYFALLKTMYK